MRESQEHHVDLVRELGLAEALSVGLGTMIGAGIFVLSALAAQRAGPAASLSYVIAGLICLPTAMTVSELVTGMPKAGGSYHLISRALGPLAGAIVGPGNWLGLTFATGFYLIGFAHYVAYFVPIPTWATVLVAGGFFVYLNYRGTKLSGRVQNVIVVVLVLILALFVVRGLFSIDPELHHPFVPYGWGIVVANVGLIIVSFTGFEKISTIAEEIKRPERNLPLAIIGSVLIATVLYAAILYVTTGILSYRTIADLEAPLLEAANRFMSVVGITGMSLAALLATASSANAAIMASSRINFAMGRDHILPEWFNGIHPRYLTPFRSVLVTGGMAIALALSGRAEVLAEISSALFMVSYALLSVGLLVMHRTRPEWYRPAYKAPLFPGLAVLGGILALGVIGTMDRASQMAGLGLIALSLGWYVLWSRRKVTFTGALASWMARERPLEAAISGAEQRIEAQRHEILVPVANPATARSLVSLAASLAQGNAGDEVTALKVVSVPLAVPLAVAQEYLCDRNTSHRQVLYLPTRHGREAGIDVRTLLQAAHNVAKGIVEVSRARPQTRMILLGWHGSFTLDNIHTGVDKEVIRAAPCDAAVFLEKGLKKAQRVLVPAGGGPHARLGLRLGHALLTNGSSQMVVLRVVPETGQVDLADEEAAVQRLVRDELGDVNGRVATRTIQATSIVEGILDEARRGYDLVVIGASEEWILRNWLFGSIPDTIAERSPCSVLLVRKHEPALLSWFRRMGKKVHVPPNS